MSDVNKNIEQWKQNLNKEDSFSTENIEELESHLKDSMAELTFKGLSEKEAFLLARHRLGETAMLSEEFSKENGVLVWGRRVLWMLLGIVIFQVGLQLSTVVVYLVSSLFLLFSLPREFMTITSVCIRVGLSCLLAAVIILGPVMYVKNEVVRNLLRRARKRSVYFGIAVVGVAITSKILPQVYFFLFLNIKGEEEVGRFLRFDQVFQYGYSFILAFIPIVGLIILDQVIRKKQARMSVDG